MNWIAIADMALDLYDKASDAVKSKASKLKEIGPLDTSLLEKIVGLVFLFVILIAAWIRKLLGFDVKKSDMDVPSDTSGGLFSGFVEGGSELSGGISGRDIMDAAVGGHAVVTSKFGADRSWNRTEEQKAKGNTKHQGTDIRAAYGTQLYAPFDGVIKNTKRTLSGSSGRSLHIVDEVNGIDVYYAHLSDINVEEGQRVKKGEPIAKSGESGNGKEHAYDPHLHIQIRRVGGEWVDPAKFTSYVPSRNTYGADNYSTDTGVSLDEPIWRWDGTGPDFNKLPDPSTMKGATQTRESQLRMAKQAWTLAQLVSKKLGVGADLIWSQYAQETGYFAISKYHGDYNFGHMEAPSKVAREGGLYRDVIRVKPGVADTANKGYYFYNFESAEDAAEATKMMFESNEWNVSGVISGIEFNRRIQSKEFTGKGYNYHAAVGDSIGKQYEAIRERYFIKLEDKEVAKVEEKVKPTVNIFSQNKTKKFSMFETSQRQQ